MAKWFHPEVNGVVDVFPNDDDDEQGLRDLGLYPAEEVESVIPEAGTTIMEQAQAASLVNQAVEARLDNEVFTASDILKRKPGRPRKA